MSPRFLGALTRTLWVPAVLASLLLVERLAPVLSVPALLALWGWAAWRDGRPPPPSATVLGSMRRHDGDGGGE